MMLYILSSLVTLLVAVWDVVEQTKNKKEFGMDYAYIFMFFVLAFVPILNVILMVMSLFIIVPEYLTGSRPKREKKKKQKYLKKQREKSEKQNKILIKKRPEMSVVITLSKILKIYTNELENGTMFLDTLNVLKSTNRYIVDNQEKPTIIKLLIEFELTFSRMLAILEDHFGTDEESFYGVINVANETINLFAAEVQKIKDNEYDLAKLANETTKARRIEELKEDLEFHKKRTESYAKI